MKTLIAFLTTVLATLWTSWAQNYYTDGSVIEDKVNCSISKYSIALTGIQQYQYPRPDTPQENNVAEIKDRSVIKQALEAVFTSEELDKYNDLPLTFGIIHDAMSRPVDVWFSFDKELGQTIPPAKFVELREKLLQLVEFRPIFQLQSGKYFSWSEDLIAPLGYYRDPRYYQPKSRTK